MVAAALFVLLAAILVAVFVMGEDEDHEDARRRNEPRR